MKHKGKDRGLKGIFYANLVSKFNTANSGPSYCTGNILPSEAINVSSNQLT